MTSRPEIERILRGKERGVSQTDWQRVPPEIPQTDSGGSEKRWRNIRISRLLRIVWAVT